MITVLAPAGSLEPGRSLTLDAAEEHHLAVRRAAPGMAIRLLDGEGATAEGHLAGGAGRFTVEIDRVEREPPPAPVVLAVGAGDRERFAILAEQAAQLGASAVQPLETALSVSVATRLRGAHLERIRRRAREAIKQSGTAWAPRIPDPVSLAEFMARPPEGARWLADRDGDAPPPLDPAEPLAVAIGPEGGFTEEERAGLTAAGFVAVRLGPHLLRFETAALAALTSAWLARQRGRHG